MEMTEFARPLDLVWVWRRRLLFKPLERGNHAHRALMVGSGRDEGRQRAVPQRADHVRCSVRAGNFGRGSGLPSSTVHDLTA